MARGTAVGTSDPASQTPSLCRSTGCGSAFAAVLGSVVIQAISSGLTLLDLGSLFRFMVTGAVLLLAVALDSAARRSCACHGRA